MDRATDSRIVSAYVLLIVFVGCVLGAFAVVAIGGCTAQQQQQQADVIDHAQAAVDSLSRAVDAAQAIVDAYQAQLAELPEDAPERTSIDDKLTRAETILARTRFDLKLAE